MTAPTEPAPTAEPRPKRLTLSEIVQLLLSRSHADRSAVKLGRDSRGQTVIEVNIRTGDNEDVATIEQAEARALEVFERLRAAYPLDPAPDTASVSLTRNAKGETQIGLEVKTGADGMATLAEAEQGAQYAYDRLRARYPMADGTTAKPGSVSP